MKIRTYTHTKHRTNPQIVWELCCMVWVALLIMTIVFGVWHFIGVNRVLDAPVEPIFTSNAPKIEEIQRNLDIVDTVVQKRVGK